MDAGEDIKRLLEEQVEWGRMGFVGIGELVTGLLEDRLLGCMGQILEQENVVTLPDD